MSSTHKAVGAAAVAVVAAAVAWLTTYGLMALWIAMVDFDGPRGEAAKAGFGAVLGAYVLGTAVGIIAGSSLIWGARRYQNVEESLVRAGWVAAPLGAMVFMFLFFYEAV